MKNILVTGGAGFIGSNILKTLLACNQKVIGLDNLATGHLRNLKSVESEVSTDNWKNFEFVKGDILDFELCQSITKDIEFVLHQAALGSVPRSIKNPIASNNSNVTGFLNILHAAKESNIRKAKGGAIAAIGERLDSPDIDLEGIEKLRKDLEAYDTKGPDHEVLEALKVVVGEDANNKEAWLNRKNAMMFGTEDSPGIYLSLIHI